MAPGSTADRDWRAKRKTSPSGVFYDPLDMTVEGDNGRELGTALEEGLGRPGAAVSPTPTLPGASEESNAGKDDEEQGQEEQPSGGDDSSTNYFASVYPGVNRALPRELGQRLSKLEAAMGIPIWMLIQQHPHHSPPFGDLSYSVFEGFYKQRADLKACGQVALVIESPGGYASAAYQIATLLRRHCEGFIAVVPSFAKSAATLLALGGEEIYMGFDAQLGPLDAQLMDPEREEVASALNEVSALERLHSVALDQFDQTMMLLTARTNKKVETLLPLSLNFTAQMMQPLLDKIDTVHYTQQSRRLKEAEDYAVRLLKPRYDSSRAEQIARRLVNEYPDHSFVIDRDEVAQFLDLPTIQDAQMEAISALEDFLMDSSVLAIGRLVKGGKDHDVGKT